MHQRFRNRFRYKGLITAVLSFTCLGSSTPVALAQSTAAEKGPLATPRQQLLSADALLSDWAILRKALLELHPGLDRYGQRGAILVALDHLEQVSETGLTRREAYLELSRFLATLQCGHTYANFWNQSQETKTELFEQPDKVPFTFRFVGQRMVIEGSAARDLRLERGVEVLALDGVEIASILDQLLPLVSADGANDNQRLNQLQLTGIGEFEPFDVFYPLVFPPDGKVAITARNHSTGESFEAVESTMTRSARTEGLASRSNVEAQTPDDPWQFRKISASAGASNSDPVGYLRLGTFVTWKMELDWKAFLKDAFDQLRADSIPDLILDLRGNAGGADEVNTALLGYLVTREIRTPPARQLVRYVEVPSDLEPHLDTWNDSIKDLSGRVEPAGDGFYSMKGVRTTGRTLRPLDRAYQGNVFVLVDAANSSATFFLARLLAANGLATLIGQPTGGNLRGTNGGQIFFLELPKTGLEVDLPLIGDFPLEEQPNRGLVPDIVVETTVDDVARGIDRVLERAKAEIVERRQAAIRP